MSKEQFYAAFPGNLTFTLLWSSYWNTNPPKIEVMRTITNTTFFSDSAFFRAVKGFNSSDWDSCKRCVLICYSRKRAEAEGRKGSFPCSKAMSSHHPTDPVELRRINFQTPGKTRLYTHTQAQTPCVVWCVILEILNALIRLTVMLFPFSAYRVSVYRGYRRLSS